MENNDINIGENPTNKRHNTILPYLISIAGSLIAIAANFITYLTSRHFFYSYKYSIVETFIDTINDPKAWLPSLADQIVFGILAAGVILSILLVIFVLAKKMTAAIVFTVLACLPFLMLNSAWIHYAGFAITLVGAVWYKIADR